MYEFEKEDNEFKNIGITCGMAMAGVVAFAVIAIFNINLAMIFALVMVLIGMMINQDF